MKRLRFGGREWKRMTGRREAERAGNSAVEAKVRGVIAAVRREGDAALVRLTRRFDGVDLQEGRLRVRAAELERLSRGCDLPLRRGLRGMARRIERFHRAQRQGDVSVRLDGGSLLADRVRPIESVGLYVPGGAAAYPSSVLMGALPAIVAGVPRVVIATPPGNLDHSAAVAAALSSLGREVEVYRVGGAQAIAALAYGTRRIAPVRKIVGPGNSFVAAAKRQVRGRVEIDGDAGPSEVVILADSSTRGDWVLADLLAQAEHGSGEETVVLVTTSRALASRIERGWRDAVQGVANPRTARRALVKRGAIVEVRNAEEGLSAVNELAAEHVQIMTRNASRLAGRVLAGAVLVGPYSPAAAGDYGIGPNHVLPTGGAARFSSPLSIRDFQRRQTEIRIARSDLGRVAPGMIDVALAEGLVGHARSLAIRSEGRST